MSSPTASTLVPPRAVALHPDSTDGLEVSLHTLPKQLLREFRHVFSDEYLSVPEAEANAGGGATWSSSPSQPTSTPGRI